MSPQADERAGGVFASLNHASFWQPLHMLPSTWLEHGGFAFWPMAMFRSIILVELGARSGFAFLAFCPAVQRLGLPTACYPIDIWAEDEHVGFYDQEVYDQLAAINAQHYGDFAQLVRSRFDQARRYFGDGGRSATHRRTARLPRGQDRFRDLAPETYRSRRCAASLYQCPGPRIRRVAPQGELIPLEFLHGYGAVGPETLQALVPLFEASAEQEQAMRAAYVHWGRHPPDALAQRSAAGTQVARAPEAGGIQRVAGRAAGSTDGKPRTADRK